MTQGNTVVHECTKLSEDEFHDSFMVMMHRLSKRYGREAVAKAMDISTRQLSNYGDGSLPSPHRIWNLLTLELTAHDELDADYGVRNVPKEATCSTDPIASKKAALLSKIVAAECPNSPGGSAVILQEILGLDEGDLRDVHARLGDYIETINAARKPERLRSVGQ